jgi:hypothetical protein
MTIQNKNKTSWGMKIVHSLFILFTFFSTVWLGLAIWFQQPINSIFCNTLIGLWLLFSIAILYFYCSQKWLKRLNIVGIYLLALSIGMLWYFNIPARSDRVWNPEVERMLSFEQHGDIVTLHNVRNFNWRTEQDYDERWETRTVDLRQLSGINVITSYWMGPQIAHTLVSFDFKNSAPITFSIEIRKEKDEAFSAIGGFFRKFELSLIAADEKDILYTRSNIRGEQVYFFPVHMSQEKMRELFEAYLQTSQELIAEPKWYNTLTSNCTTIVFDMAQSISNTKLPIDYRLLASGYLPNYLYDLKALDNKISMYDWYLKAHVNPKTKQYNHLTSQQYSTLIRQEVQSIYAGDK